MMTNTKAVKIIGPSPGTEMNAGTQTTVASRVGMYGNHIDTHVGTCDVDAAAAGAAALINAATPISSSPAAQPKSMRLAVL
jgi:hypothetical protein